MKQHILRSVGIDIGTTTTQLVFSLLHVANSAGPAQVPRYAIVKREITYKSPVIFTPRNKSGGEGALDEKALAVQIARWYDEAGLKPADVPTGAAIITGESLKASNARDTVMEITRSLGDFVVATAGPHLESIVAGKGSGAALLSAQERKTVLNIDIGGGTANYAVFRNGGLVETACIAIGGRLIEVDASGFVTYVYPAARMVADAVLGAGKPVTPETLPRVIRAMADMLYELAWGRVDEVAQRLMQTAPLSQNNLYDAIIVSGGVGYCLDNSKESLEHPYAYGDIGPLLATAISEHEGFASLHRLEASSTVRATVIGAGAWSLSLSGATVWADENILPLKNIPIIPIELAKEEDAARWALFFQETLQQRDINTTTDLFALGFKDIPATYHAVRLLSEQLCLFWKSLPSAKRPFVIIILEDIGKIMGMELKADLPEAPLIVLDEVQFADGDYIDIGAVQSKASFLPVVIKSLAFPEKTQQE